MKGKHTVRISDSRVQYDFELIRNITVVQGNSGTGKTTLFEMISAYARLKENSGVRLVCDKPCVPLRPDSDWDIVLEKTRDSIVFIDEESAYVGTKEFAAVIQRTDNYYVIFNRENLYNLPYSVEEIYEIHTAGKYHSFRKMYRQQSGCRYFADKASSKNEDFSVLITEDSKSGFEFYQQYFNESPVECVSAGANSSIYSWLTSNTDKKIFVIADGAAFGAEMNRIMSLQVRHPNITVCLPESFEWLILRSGILEIVNLEDVLENPSDSIESSEYFSWERFFTDYLVQNTQGTHYSYSKNALHPYYAVRNNMERIVAVIGLGE